MAPVRLGPTIRTIARSFAGAFTLAVAALLPSAPAKGLAATGDAQRRPDAVDSSASTLLIGRSVEGRPIEASRIGPPGARVSLLVVGSIAGDEPAGIGIAEALQAVGAVPGVTLWLIADMNPDGQVRGVRGNAHGVDLNRNFPFAWRPVASRHSRYYGGRRPLSEPESRALATFVRRVRPTLTIWLHQPYGLVDNSEGPLWAERIMARRLNLPLERLPDYPGSAIGWGDHLRPGSAFDVEIAGAGSLNRTEVGRYVDAIRAVEMRLASR